MFEFHCPVCLLARPLPERALGRTFRCPHCDSKIKSWESGPLEVIERREPPPVVAQEPIAAVPPPLEDAPTPPFPIPAIPSGSVTGSPLTGRTIGNYLIIGLLGSGAQSNVYLAEHQHLRRRNALKLLPPDAASTPEKTSKLLNEAYQLAKVDSPFVVRVYDCGVHENAPYLAMEHVEGVTLDERIKAGGPLRGAALSDMVLQLLHGLKAVHAAALLHGDIKPTNILLTKDGQAKLADFGLAREALTADPAVPEKIFKGTAEYAAPELALGRPADQRTDLYALGATLYKAVTGRVPFPGDSTTEKLKKQLYEPLIPLRVYAPDLPPPLETFISTLLDKDPEKRPRSVTEALAFFDSLKPTPPQAEPPRAAPSPPTHRKPAPRTRRVLILNRPGTTAPFLILLLFGGLVGGGILIYLKRTQPSPPAVVRADRPETSKAAAPASGAEIKTPAQGSSSVLFLLTRRYLSGVVTEKGDGYEIREGDTLTVIPKSDVAAWYRYSGEMGSPALQEMEEVKSLVTQAGRQIDPVRTRKLFMEARTKAAHVEQTLSLVRRFFVGKDDDWVDLKLQQARSLLKITRDALASDSASSPSSSPGAEAEAKSTPPQPFDLILPDSLLALLKDPDLRRDTLSRRNARDLLLKTASQGGDNSGLSAMLVFLSINERNWSLLTDRLTAKGEQVEYRGVSGQVVRRTALGFDFELTQGGVIRVAPGKDRTTFTPQGGQLQTAVEYKLEENALTPSAKVLEAYFQDTVSPGFFKLETTPHLFAAQRLSAAITQHKRQDPQQTQSLELFCAAHLNEALAKTPSAVQLAALETILETLGWRKSRSSGYWGAPALLAWIERGTDTGKADLERLAVAGDPEALFLISHQLLRALDSGAAVDFEKAASSFQKTARLPWPTALKNYLHHMEALLQAAVPCKSCGGAYSATGDCRSCKGRGLRDFACGACSGHGYVLTLVPLRGLVRSPCRACGGAREFQNQTCRHCKGSGKIDCKSCDGAKEKPDMDRLVETLACPTCRGDGVLFSRAILACPDCRGLGHCVIPRQDPRAAFARPYRERDWQLLTPRSAPPAPAEPRDVFRLQKAEDLRVREGAGQWRVSEEGLQVRGLDNKTTSFELQGVKLPRQFILETTVTLSKEDSRLPSQFGIEMDAGTDRPVWLLSIQNSSGSVILYQLATGAAEWQAVASTAPDFISPAAAASGFPLRLHCDGTRLDVLVNQVKAFTTTLPRELSGGRVRLRCQGALVQAGKFQITQKD